MNAPTVILLIGSLGLFPTRAFLPAFLTAFLFRFGHQIPGLKDQWLVQSLGEAPAWFTHDATLVVLGLLSVLELVATKSSDARAFLEELEKYYKPALAFLTTLGILGAADSKLVETIQHAGLGSSIPAFFAASGVFLLTTLRVEVLGFLREADQDDDLGVQKLISWIEDLWAGFGFFILVLYPLLMLVLAALGAGGLWALRVYFNRREERSKVPCAACGEPIYPTALACPKCKAKAAAPRAVGFFGGARPEPATDLLEQQYRLIEKKRCPLCASHLPERNLRQRCAACGEEVGKDGAFAGAYAERVQKRLPKALGVAFLFGLVPIVGLIPGILYYRTQVVAPFRRYVPWSIGCLVKFGMRILILVLILFQLVPLVGAFMLPLMALLENFTYRGIFMSLGARKALN